MSNMAHKTLAIVTVMALGIAAPAIAAVQNQAPAATLAEPDPAAVQRVVDAINAAIAAQPATASAQDVEAAVMFAISQQQQSPAVAAAALAFVAAQPGNAKGKVRVALNNARNAVRQGQSGTGGTGGSAASAATLGAGPSVGGGGVGVNYTTQN